MTDVVRIRSFGSRGALVELTGNDAVHVVAAHLRRHFDDCLDELIPGHSTVLITWKRPIGRSELVSAIGEAEHRIPELAAGEPIVIVAVYDGPDLSSVAEIVGLSPEEVVRRHTAPTYRVGFIGFAPGFAYLLDGDPMLQVARRSEPRTRVPAGSVAIAGEYSTIYPSPSPGGWQLIGTTSVRTFDPRRTPPALIEPGAAVRFQARM
jgi:KipI family sensor histidine kinase inhibitor